MSIAPGDTVERLNPDGTVWYRAVVDEVDPRDVGGLVVRVAQDDCDDFERGDKLSAPWTAFGKPCWRPARAARLEGEA